MNPNKRYLNQPLSFWALVKLSSEALGYSDRKSKGTYLRRFKLKEILDLKLTGSFDVKLAKKVTEYLNFRAILIEEQVRPYLMDRKEAKETFKRLVKNYKPKCHLPMNKQKGEKRHYSYLTCIVNILAERFLKKSFEDNPSSFVVITDKSNKIATTLSRWFDGAYPSIHNPKAVWEIKEYYGTTTFGSRVADGVYESQLDVTK